jgi:hypothetical protein
VGCFQVNLEGAGAEVHRDGARSMACRAGSSTRYSAPRKRSHLIAAVGFTEQSPWPILLAALLAVPSSIVALPLYCLAYGFLALVPEAKPSSSSGSATFAPDGRMLTSVSTGMPAVWFTISTFVLGILALTVAALVNVLLLRALAARRRSKVPVTTQSSPQGD